MKTCYCHTCEKAFHYLGINSHRAYHRRRMQDCDITYTHGDRKYFNFSNKNHGKMANELTPMQKFALEVLTTRGDSGARGAFVGNRWQERNGRRAKVASRDSFGATAAGYKALRALVDKGLARVEMSKTTGGYSIETYFKK